MTLSWNFLSAICLRFYYLPKPDLQKRIQNLWLRNQCLFWSWTSRKPWLDQQFGRYLCFSDCDRCCVWSTSNRRQSTCWRPLVWLQAFVEVQFVAHYNHARWRHIRQAGHRAWQWIASWRGGWLASHCGCPLWIANQVTRGLALVWRWLQRGCFVGKPYFWRTLLARGW